MSVVASPITREGLTYIIRNLRPRDRAEIFALRWDDNEEMLVNQILSLAGDMWVMWSLESGEPIAVNGVIPSRPGVCIVGAFGTTKWRAAIRPITRYTLDFAIPLLKRLGYHRGEAYVMASNTDSRRWIEMLGGEIEALLKGWGRNREDYFIYAWDLTREDSDVFLRRRQFRAERSAHADHGRH